MSLKVMIINPDTGFASGPVRCPPIRAGYIASLLRAQHNDVSVRIVDCKIHTRSYTTDALVQDRPDLAVVRVGLNICGFAASALPSSEEIIRLIRAYSPATKIVACGPYPTLAGEDILENEAFGHNVDFLVVGEEERPILALVEKLLGADADISKVAGLWFRNGAGWQRNARAPFVDDLDTLPFPDYELIETDRYEHLAILTSRGCEHPCGFCSVGLVAGKKFRARSCQNVLDELQVLARRFGTEKYLCFLDEDFFHDRVRTKKILERMVDEHLNFRWKVKLGARIDEVDQEILELAKEAGCIGLSFGVESGSTQVLKRMGKGITVDQVRETASLLKKVGIDHCFFVQIGNPGESAESAAETLRLLSETRPNRALVNMVIPYPHTAVEAWVRRNGRILREPCFDSYYENDSGAVPEPAFETKEFSRKERIRMFRKVAILVLALRTRGLRQLFRHSLHYARQNPPRYWPDVLRLVSDYFALRMSDRHHRGHRS